jgi:hypothetical protein
LKYVIVTVCILNVHQRYMCWRLIPADGAIRRWWNLWKMGPIGGKLSCWGVLLKGLLGPWTLPLTVFCCCSFALSHASPSMTYCFATDPETTEPNDLWNSQNKSFLLRYFVTVMESWPAQPIFFIFLIFVLILVCLKIILSNTMELRIWV